VTTETVAEPVAEAEVKAEAVTEAPAAEAKEDIAEEKEKTE
jgi:hypothetical protein